MQGMRETSLVGARVVLLIGLAMLAPWRDAGAQTSGDAPVSPADALTRNSSSTAPASGTWHTLTVPGGRIALDTLGVPAETSRALVLTDLVRRLHFANDDRPALEAAIVALGAATQDLAVLQNAILAAAPASTPLTLATAARPANARRRLRDAVEAAGLRVREVRGQLVVEENRNNDAVQLRARLMRLGVDASALQRSLAAGGPLVLDVPSVTLPLPVSPQTWRRAGVDVPASQLFIAILSDPSARLLYHGLMSLDPETRQWLDTQPDLLRDLSRNTAAVRAFALFAPPIHIRNGALLVPGGDAAAARWSSVLDATPAQPAQFIRRLFTRDNGRIAGLYAAVGGAPPARQTFLLGAGAGDRFGALVSAFVACYEHEIEAYPFAQRAADPALLLLEIPVTGSGQLAGPSWRRFWTRVFDGDRLPADPVRDLRDVADDGRVDAAWLVATLCGASADVRQFVFETLLFVPRVFGGATDDGLPDVLRAARARRAYPAIAQALEQAGITSPVTYGRVARAADAVARIDDPGRAIPLLQQFQGAVALTTAAIRAGTLTIDHGGRLLESLAAIPLRDGRYDGQLARWLGTEWLTAVGAAAQQAPLADSGVEAVVIAALSGPAATSAPVEWEGLTYVLDLAGTKRRQLRDARQRQGGLTLDTVLALSQTIDQLRAADLPVAGAGQARARLGDLRPRLERTQAVEELGDDVPKLRERLDSALRDLARIDEPRRLSRARGVADDLTPLLDVLLGQTLAAWAYAPHLAESGAQAIVGSGDPSSRHELGVRLPDRRKAIQPWEIAWRGDVSGRVSGSLLGLDAALARHTLKRLSTDGFPARPTMNANDIVAVQLTAALSDPRLLTDADRDRMTRAIAAGEAEIVRAGTDAAILATTAHAAGVSPWRVAAIGWLLEEEPARMDRWFSAAELARIGGLPSETMHAWGTALTPAGCLCLRMAPDRHPELLLGRGAAALLPYLSAGVMFQIAPVLARHGLPAPVAQAVQPYALRDVIDRTQAAHIADIDAITRAIASIDRARIEDFLGAVAALGPLREIEPTP